MRRSLRGLGGGQPPTSTHRVYTGALLAATTAPRPILSTISLYFSLNQGNKFTGTHIKRISDFPKCFKVGLFVPVLDHRQMSAGNSCKTAQSILGYTLFIAKAANCSPNRTIVELHCLTPLPHHIVYHSKAVRKSSTICSSANFCFIDNAASRSCSASEPIMASVPFSR